MQKKIFFVLLLVLFVLTLGMTAYGEKQGDYTYEVNHSTNACTITEYTGNEKTVIVPEELGGYPVTIIGQSAFEGCTAEKILLPSSVKHIHNRAFCYSDLLVEVVLPEGLESIGDCSFGYCEYLVYVNIPDTVRVINEYAFNCSYGVILTVSKGSYAERYVQKHPDIRFTVLDTETSQTSQTSQTSPAEPVTDNGSFWKTASLVSASVATVFVLFTASVCVRYALGKRGDKLC